MRKTPIYRIICVDIFLVPRCVCCGAGLVWCGFGRGHVKNSNGSPFEIHIFDGADVVTLLVFGRCTRVSVISSGVVWWFMTLPWLERSWNSIPEAQTSSGSCDGIKHNLITRRGVRFSPIFPPTFLSQNGWFKARQPTGNH